MKRDSGQVLLITLLVLTIATTVALSLIGRSTTDLSVSRQLEESARAFSAAEAGIEQALQSGTGGTQVLTAGSSYDVAITSIGGAAGTYVLPKKTPRGVTETIWLVAHDSAGALVETPTYTGNTIDLCWSSESTLPALVVSALYKESTDGSYNMVRVALDPDVDRQASGNFTAVSAAGTNCNAQNYYRYTVDFTDLGVTPAADTILALRIRPEYADTSIIIDPGGFIIPQQGNRIESVGATQGGVSRKVIVYQQYRAPSSVFDSVVYSQSSFGH